MRYRVPQGGSCSEFFDAQGRITRKECDGPIRETRTTDYYVLAKLDRYEEFDHHQVEYRHLDKNKKLIKPETIARNTYPVETRPAVPQD